MGFFFNGDGSALGIVSPDGKILSNIEVSTLLLDEWIQAKGQEYDIYTEIFTPSRVNDLLSGYDIKTYPLHQLHENNKNWDRAIIWDRNGVIFSPFIPDRDGILQSLLLAQALSRDNMDWQKYTERMEGLTGGHVADQKILHLDSSMWDKKQKALLTKSESLSGKLVQVLEEGEDKKLCFEDGSWVGLSYNAAESSLNLLCKNNEQRKAEEVLSQYQFWLTE